MLMQAKFLSDGKIKNIIPFADLEMNNFDQSIQVISHHQYPPNGQKICHNESLSMIHQIVEAKSIGRVTSAIDLNEQMLFVGDASLSDLDL